MFVNISPANFNLEETKISLYYASRAKKITNESQKNIETSQITKLRMNYDSLMAALDACAGVLRAHSLALPVLAEQYIVTASTKEEDTNIYETPISHNHTPN